MKKLSKILASVLTVAMAMSTVVMPITAEAAADSRYGTVAFWYDFTDSGNATKIGGTQFDGMGGKHVADKISKIPATSARNICAPITTTGGVVTYEAQVYFTPGGEGIFHIFNENGLNERLAVKFRGDGTIATSTTLTGNDVWAEINTSRSDATYSHGVWNKLAIEWNAIGRTVKFYLNDSLIRTVDITKEASRAKFNGDIGFANMVGTNYVDNLRIYAAPYVNTSEEIKPEAGGEHRFIADSMTVAEVKEELLAEQTNASELVAHVYKYGIGGEEAADTDVLVKGWYAVVTSKAGEFYNTVYQVEDPMSVSATLSFGDLIATVTKHIDVVTPSMIMVLIHNNGQVVKASEAKTNVGLGTTTFTIEDVGSILVNPKILFINTWDELAPILDETIDVMQ